MLAAAEALTGSGDFAAMWASVESARTFERIEDGEAAFVDTIARAARWQLSAELMPPPWPQAPPGRAVAVGLQAWAERCPRPVALFLDEVDGLAPAFLASVLSQLRGGFAARPRAFPASVALIGLRDVRDYAIEAGGASRRGAGSPFNVKARSLTLTAFMEVEIAALLGQHTDATGQAFSPSALARVSNQTRGQPWLVNALAAECVDATTGTVDVRHVDEAVQRLILGNDTHLDSLTERLREPRVRAVIEPMIAGEPLGDVPEDDQRYVLELGLARLEDGRFEVANPIYREVIPRALSATAQRSLPRFEPVWLDDNGRLDTARLLAAFVDFWRQHGTALMGTAPYHEVAPQLVTMAFLHRVVNGGGTVEREYAVTSGRIDLCVRHGDVTLGVELKVWRQGRPDPLAAGLTQLDRYLDGIGQDTGWLVIFDRRAARTGETTVDVSTATSPGGREISVLRAAA